MADAAHRLVIFDCDGVLVDSEPISLQMLVELLSSAGVTISAEEANERFLGRSLKSMSAILHEDYGFATNQAFLHDMRQRLYEKFRRELRPVAGVRTAVELLGAASCVASSSLPERIRLSLTVTGLIDTFEPNIFSATMVTQGKPAPDLFLYACREMGFAPKDCVVVEDSPAGIEAAKAAGMRVFAFAGGSHARNYRHRMALAALNPEVLFDDMVELPELASQ
ncbi:HAD family hydrolase [Ensifer sp. 22521]|uniref:HAD family hydrolase n=1 Tax=Ensifer sp. 22521 TaxID=3453935 RepID=UPI003F863D64